MRESTAVVEAWLRFCEGVSNKLVKQLDDIVSAEAKLIIGTAPGENVTDRAAMRFGFEAEGVTLQSREARASRKDPWPGSLMSPGSDFPTGRAWTAESPRSSATRRGPGGSFTRTSPLGCQTMRSSTFSNAGPDLEPLTASQPLAMGENAQRSDRPWSRVPPRDSGSLPAPDSASRGMRPVSYGFRVLPVGEAERFPSPDRPGDGGAHHPSRRSRCCRNLRTAGSVVSEIARW